MAEQPFPSTSKEVFIVRLWRETLDQPTWRGQVQHIPTGRVVYVRSLGELLDYIQSQIDQVNREPTKKRGLK